MVVKMSSPGRSFGGVADYCLHDPRMPGVDRDPQPAGVREASPQALHHFTQADQLCIVHQVRNALSYVSYKDRKAVAADLKKIYKSAPLEEAEQQLDLPRSDLERTLPDDPPLLGPALEQRTAFFAYPPEIRKVIYTTNAIESLNRSMRHRDRCDNGQAHEFAHCKPPLKKVCVRVDPAHTLTSRNLTREFVPERPEQPGPGRTRQPLEPCEFVPQLQRKSERFNPVRVRQTLALRVPLVWNWGPLRSRRLSLPSVAGRH